MNYRNAYEAGVTRYHLDAEQGVTRGPVSGTGTYSAAKGWSKCGLEDAFWAGYRKAQANSPEMQERMGFTTEQ